MTNISTWRRIAVAVALIPAVAGAQKVPDAFTPVRAVIRQAMQERGIASISVAAARGGKIVWEEGFGWANRERHIAATARTMYSLASISKPITATGLMVLVERSKLDLERPVNDYLGSGKLTALEGNATGATVRRVANHTAGLPTHYTFFYANDGHPRPSMDESIAHYGILVAPPGTLFNYSNLGFGILDHVIERASGTPFEVFMRREVFEPLGLKRMAIVTAPISGDTVAERYDGNGAIPGYDFDHRGASAVYASAHDLARFGMFHLKDHLADQRRILSDATLDEMHRPTAQRSESVGYGIGWQTFTDDHGYTSLGHSGGMPGVSTLLRIYPAEDVVVVVLTNGWEMNGANNGNAVAPRVGAEIAAVLMPKYAEQLRASQTEVRQAAAPPRFVAPEPITGEWRGSVRTWQGAAVPLRLVVRPDGAVLAKLGDAPEAHMINPRWQNATLSGSFAGTIPTPDASRLPHTINLSVRLHDGVLSGAALASANAAPNRLGYGLPSYATLTRRGAR